MAKESRTSSLSEPHKAALAAGRTQGRAVRIYLEALDANKPKRGRKRTLQSITARLATVERELPTADPLKRLLLAQERLDLQDEIARAGNIVDFVQLEREFVETALEYSQRKGISYSAWRELGVASSLLKRAGISRETAPSKGR